jgi:hypothetical protein
MFTDAKISAEPAFLQQLLSAANRRELLLPSPWTATPRPRDALVLVGATGQSPADPPSDLLVRQDGADAFAAALGAVMCLDLAQLVVRGWRGRDEVRRE